MKRTMKKFLLLILTVLMTAFVGVFVASCGEELGTLKSSKILYDGNYITWSRVSGAKEYVVIVNGAAAKTVDQTKKGEAPKYKFPSKGRDEVNVSIQPIGKEEEGKKVSRTFTRLTTIQTSDITFSEEGVMSWNIVEGADSYMIKLGDTEVSVSVEEYSEFVYDGKSTSIQIRPITTDGSTFSDYSSSISKVFLAEISPEDLTYDGEKLSWQGQGYAKGYEIYIGGAYKDKVEYNKTEYFYNADNKSFTASVKALGDGTSCFTSPAADDKQFTFLPVISDLKIDNGKLVWTEVEEADSYAITNNNIRVADWEAKVKVNDLGSDLGQCEVDLPAGTNLSLAVKPVMKEGDVYFSAYSEVLPAYILPTPEIKWELGFALDDGEEANAISWNDVGNNAGGYQVQIQYNDKQPEFTDYGVLQRYHKYGFPEVGKYLVSVKAKAGSVDVYDSKFSSTITVERLAAPEKVSQNFIVSDPSDNTKFTATWQRNASASGYAFYKEGTKVDSLTTQLTTQTVTGIVESTVSTAQKIKYEIQSLGKVETNSDGTPRIVLNSLLSKNLSFDITVLAMPQNVNIQEGSTVLAWSNVANANDYVVSGTGGDPATVRELQFNLLNLSSGSHSLKVCAKGNGQEVLASNYTPAVNTYRLEYPTNLKIGTEGSAEGKWQWDEVTNARSYSINIAAQNYSLEVQNAGALVQENLIKTDGSVTAVRANANYWGSNSVYYIESEECPTKTFIKLQAPTFNTPIVVGKTLQWNAPSNVAASQYTPTYVLYKDVNTRYSNGVCNGPEKQLTETYFPADTYTFLVKAIGNANNASLDAQYINSDMSVQKTVRILAMPNVKREAGKTAYEWTSVAGATGYNVVINGKVVEEVKLSSTSNDYSYNPTQHLVNVNGDYEVQISARGNDNNAELNNITTIESWPYTVNQNVKRLNSPTITFEYQNEAGEKLTNFDKNAYVVVKISSESANANGYQYTIGGHTSEINQGKEYKFQTRATGKFEIMARACGGKFDAEGNYYIDSHQVHANEANSIEILAEPTNIELDTDGYLQWNYNGTPVNGFSVKLYYGETVLSRDFDTAFPLEQFKTTGLTKIEVCAKGNGTTIIGSQWVAKTSF